MEPDLVELRAQGDQALFNFLKTDLDISLTNVRLFQTERQLHDEVGSEQARLNAEKAIR